MYYHKQWTQETSNIGTMAGKLNGLNTQRKTPTVCITVTVRNTTTHIQAVSPFLKGAEYHMQTLRLPSRARSPMGIGIELAVFTGNSTPPTLLCAPLKL